MFKGVQIDILNSKAKSILVSAGAGSGKTTVMINKIANLIINEGVDVNNLLVVTFTVLAAEEMKQRLIKRLTEEMLNNPSKSSSLLTIIEQLKTASIDTIDGFASKTIKKYFYELEISPNVNIISDATKDYYLTLAMNKTMDDFSKDIESVSLLLDIFAGNSRNLEPIKNMVISCYKNIVSLENPIQFLDSVCAQYENTAASENVLNLKICNLAKFVQIKISELYSGFENKIQTKLSGFFTKLNLFNVKLAFKYNLKLMQELEFPKFSSKEKQENTGLIDLVCEIKKFESVKKDFEENEINLNFDEKAQKCVQYLTIFIEIVKNFIKNYAHIKERNNLIDFNDLNRLMLKLLENDKIKNELQEKYTYVFIDEYQDVNPLQDRIMTSLLGEKTKLFMVGDVKQSIYAFRGATPEGFLNKYNSIKQGLLEGEKFDMNLNFRSSPTILNFINELFFKIMTEESSGINYKQDCEIEPQRADIVDDKVHIALFAAESKSENAKGVYSVKQDNSERSNYSAEAKYILKTITELYGTEFYDANLKQVRTLTYSDFAILGRSEKDAQAQMLIDLLKNNAIPVNVANKLDIKSSEVVKLILSILKCVIGSADDVDYLAALMALTNLTIDELIEIRDTGYTFQENLINSTNINIQTGFKILEEIKQASYVSTNTELIRYILNSQNLKYYILRQQLGNKELNLLEEFLNKISPIEDSLNLAEFVDMIESNIGKSSDFNSKDNEDSVTVQTIHKSKGLEYPVVFLFGAGRTFASDTDLINFNSEIGLGVDFFDFENRIKIPSIVKYAINEKNKQKNYKEEMRLLYVALTRAKNKLYITGNYTKTALIKKEFTNNSYVNMILDCFIDRIISNVNELKNCIIEVFDEFDYCLDNKQTQKVNVELKGLDFEYENAHKFKIPLKNSVTSINSEVSQQTGFKTKQWLTQQTQYNANEDKALIGTHYHKALELLDLQNRYVKNTDFEDVDYVKIEQAHKDLSSLAKDAITIEKEAEFMMYVPYNLVVESDVEDKVLIQGMVDLIIENKSSITIVDYKFSGLKAESLKEKYLEQLKLYKLAVEYAYNKPVEHMFLYSINSAELIEV